MMNMTKILPITFCAGLMAFPLAAQEGDGKLSQGMDLLQQGTRLLLESLMEEIGPALQGLEDAVIDLNAYQTPEILPNGDILIRRKTPLEADPLTEDPLEDGEVEL